MLCNLVILVAALPFTYILTFQLSLPGAGASVLLGMCMIGIGMGLVRLSGRLSIASHWCSFSVYLTITAIMYLTGGIESPGLWWLIICPIYALLFSGLHGGLFWTNLIILTGIGFYFGTDPVGSFASLLPEHDRHWLILSSFLGLIFCVIGYVTAYRYFITDHQMLQLKKERKKEREAREKAQRANRAKTQFLANTSHEIRTPINTITGAIEVLRASDLTGEQRENLDMAEESAHDLLDTINDILDMSRLEAGLRDEETGPVRVREVFSDLLQTLAPDATEKGVELRLRVAHEVPINLSGDEEILRQIIYNLVDNAILYTSSGHVCVYVDVERLEARTCRLRIYVRDTGIGIPEEEQELIFDSFQRSSHSLMDEIRGTGLGLTITQNLVELLNGDIEVDSTPGDGSTFFAAVELQLEGNDPVYPSYQTEDLRGIRVLVFSETEGGENPVLRYLRDWEMTPTFVHKSEELLEELKKDRAYDLLLLNLMGHERFETVLPDRDELEGRIPPVLALVQPGKGSTMPGHAFVDAHVRSPVHPEILLKNIKEVFTAHHVTERSEAVPSDRDKTDFASRNILFAEDNSPVRGMVTKQLENLGYDVTPVSNGREAVDHVRGNGYDLVLMDVQMPELDGIEATREIRGMEDEGGKCRIPIVALTAQALKKDRDRCLAAGMTAYLTKPADSETLQNTIDRVLSGNSERSFAGNGNESKT